MRCVASMVASDTVLKRHPLSALRKMGIGFSIAFFAAMFLRVSILFESIIRRLIAIRCRGERILWSQTDKFYVPQFDPLVSNHQHNSNLHRPKHTLGEWYWRLRHLWQQLDRHIRDSTFLRSQPGDLHNKLRE